METFYDKAKVPAHIHANNFINSGGGSVIDSGGGRVIDNGNGVGAIAASGGSVIDGDGGGVIDSGGGGMIDSGSGGVIFSSGGSGVYNGSDGGSGWGRGCNVSVRDFVTLICIWIFPKPLSGFIKVRGTGFGHGDLMIIMEWLSKR